MKLLLDTHTFLWFVWGDPQLSAAAKALIVSPSNQKLLSAASFWEIAIKVSVGKLKLGEPYASFMPRELTRNSIDLLPISLEHAAAASVLPFHHRDPFDRMLIAQSMVDAVPLVSADPALDLYPVTRLW